MTPTISTSTNACTRCGHDLPEHALDLGPCDLCDCKAYAFITFHTEAAR